VRDQQERPRRKPRPMRARSCARSGCTQTVMCRKPGKRWCSPLCRLIADELHKAQRVTEALGPTPFGVQLWAELVTLGDSWERAQQVSNAIRRAATSVGISVEARPKARAEGKQPTSRNC